MAVSFGDCNFFSLNRARILMGTPARGVRRAGCERRDAGEKHWSPCSGTVPARAQCLGSCKLYEPRGPFPPACERAKLRRLLRRWGKGQGAGETLNKLTDNAEGGDLAPRPRAAHFLLNIKSS